jgi:DNA-binding MarR family transcriptional regulator
MKQPDANTPELNQPPAHPSESAFRAFMRTFGLLRNKMDAYFLQYGISGTQWGVLRVLQRAEGEGLEGLRLMDLGQRLVIKPPSVTGIVDRLERLGLVTREAAVTDLRAKQVRLTAKGRNLLTRVLQHHPEQIHKVMAGLTEMEQDELQRLMKQLTTHLQSLEMQDAVYTEEPHQD